MGNVLLGNSDDSGGDHDAVVAGNALGSVCVLKLFSICQMKHLLLFCWMRLSNIYFTIIVRESLQK